MSKNNNKSKDYESKESYSKDTTKKGSRRYENRSAKTAESNGKPKYKTGQIHYINNMVGGKNDISWYNRIKSVFNDATLVSFFNQLGALFKVSSNPYPELPFEETTSIPGVMALNMVTVPGYSKDINAPASVAAVSAWEWIRSRLNKLNPDYGPADLHNVTFCEGDFISNYCNLLRLIGLINMYDANNFYIPYALIAGGYFDEDVNALEFIRDFQNNAANYVDDFNYIITEASAILFMPEDYAITQRHSWLFNNVYRDSHSAKAQLYIHRKMNFYLFNETDFEGSAATCHSFMSYFRNKGITQPKFSDYLDIMREQLEALRNSSSVRIMIADMRQAFADRNQVGMMYVDKRYTAPFEEQDDVLMQIENSEVLVMSDEIKNWFIDNQCNLTQDPDSDAVIFAPIVPYTRPAGIVEAEWNKFITTLRQLLNRVPMLNLHQDNTPERVMESTRNMYVLEQNERGYNFTAFGADLIVGSEVLRLTDNGYTCERFDPYFMLESDDNTRLAVYNQAYAFAMAIAAWCAFDWAPKANVWAVEFEAADPENPDGELNPKRITPFIMWEWDNYTTLDNAQIARMHRCALQSMWNVPEYGAFKAG